MHTQTIPAALLTPRIACVIPATAEVLRFGGFESLSKQLWIVQKSLETRIVYAGAGAIYFHMTFPVLKGSCHSSSGFQADTVSPRGETMAMHIEIQRENVFMGMKVMKETGVRTDTNCSFPSLIIFLGCAVCVCMGHDMKVSWETPLW